MNNSLVLRGAHKAIKFLALRRRKYTPKPVILNDKSDSENSSLVPVNDNRNKNKNMNVIQIKGPKIRIRIQMLILI